MNLFLRGRTSTFDVEVVDARGELVWRRLENEIIPAIVHVRMLPAGEHFELSATWNQRTHDSRPVARGEYIARGFLLTEDASQVTPPASFVIVSGKGVTRKPSNP